MNNNFKFRIWIDGVPYYMTLAQLAYSNNFPIDGKVVQQFTGHFDNNGWEIYEGDILRVGEDDDWSWVNGKKKYRNMEVAPLLPKKSFSDSAFELFVETDHEIIGNVIQNPELLK